MVRLLATFALLLPLLATAGTPTPARLRVQVRDSAPAEPGGYRRSADGGYVAGTGGGASSDRGGNGATWSTSAAPRELVLAEGEPVRVDLPAVQSLQFHVPAGAAGRPGSGGTTAQGAAPSASGVVYFDAVSAFAARFYRQKDHVRIDLVPLRNGGVAAPFVDAQGGGGALQHPVSLGGRLGEWIALGDTEVSTPARSLMPTAEAPSAPGVWVRVLPADDQP